MKVVPCTADHIDDFLSRPVRPEDHNEWLVGTGHPPHHVLPHCLGSEGSTVRALVDNTGRCLAIWGIYVTGSEGNVWLIASTAAKAQGWKLNRRWAAAEFAKMKTMAPSLFAMPWEEQHLHHRWLEWLGFRFTKRVAMGAGVFRQYEWRANVH